MSREVGAKVIEASLLVLKIGFNVGFVVRGDSREDVVCERSCGQVIPVQRPGLESP